MPHFQASDWELICDYVGPGKKPSGTDRLEPERGVVGDIVALSVVCLVPKSKVDKDK